MASNLVHNAKQALEGFPVSDMYRWLDSKPALYWLNRCGENKQLVHNRAQIVLKKAYIKWQYVNTKEKPADLGSGGCTVNGPTKLWLNGPKWLSKQENWPSDITTTPRNESVTKLKPIKEILAVAVEEKNPLDELLEKHELWKTIRIMAWTRRFICKSQTVQQIEQQIWPHHYGRNRSDDELLDPENAKRWADQSKMWRRPSKAQLTRERRSPAWMSRQNSGCLPYIRTRYKSIQREARGRRSQGNGRVGYTMTKIRNTYCISRLRRLVKRVIHKCKGWKRFQVKSLHNPPIGNLSKVPDNWCRLRCTN